MKQVTNFILATDEKYKSHSYCKQNIFTYEE